MFMGLTTRDQVCLERPEGLSWTFPKLMEENPCFDTRCQIDIQPDLPDLKCTSWKSKLFWITQEEKEESVLPGDDVGSAHIFLPAY